MSSGPPNNSPNTVSNIFGIGITSNNNLDLLNLIVLACAGIVIKLFFSENYSRLGNVGPATTTIWGYGLTSLALTIMIFVAISYTNKDKNDETLFGNKINFFASLGTITPIILTLLVMIYIIYLNFLFFTRINTNKVTPDYHTYSFMSSTLLLLQILLISNYLFKILNKTSSKEDVTLELTKMLTYVLAVVNMIFILMIHISLVFFSTDEMSSS
jgi:magnesium-transporting ATPase (P-type)